MMWHWHLFQEFRFMFYNEVIKPKVVYQNKNWYGLVRMSRNILKFWKYFDYFSLVPLLKNFIFFHFMITYIYMYVFFKKLTGKQKYWLLNKRENTNFLTQICLEILKNVCFFSQIIFYEHILKPKYHIINSDLLKKSCIIVNL